MVATATGYIRSIFFAAVTGWESLNLPVARDIHVVALTPAQDKQYSDNGEKGTNREKNFHSGLVFKNETYRKADVRIRLNRRFRLYLATDP